MLKEIAICPEMVSVIMPNYNCSEYIGEAIAGVCSQTYKNWEMIIVDDCSTDNSVELIQRHVKCDRRIRLFKTLSCSGSPLEPRNVGLQEAIGRYVAFLDSDDAWLPEKLEKQLKFFDDEKTAVVFSNYEKMTEDGMRSGRVIRAPYLVNYNKLMKSNCIGNLTAVYDTQKTGKVFFSYSFHEDYVLWLTILQKGFVARNTNTVEALYRVRSSSVSSKKKTALKWQWDIYRKQLNLSLMQSLYCFLFYIINGFLKYIR